MLVCRCVQPEEKARLAKFCFQRDAKASLVGRLLQRKYCSEVSGVSYDQIKFKRDENNKPILEGPLGSKIYFNVSHSGNYVVLAGSTQFNVGIDVNQVEERKDTQEFFRLMNRQFSSNEWANIRSYRTDPMQMRAFIRHWCLKEAYVKAVGTGIAFDLERIDFIVSSELGLKTVTDTKVKIDGKLLEDWVFEESILGSDHIVSVASNASSPSGQEFQFIDFDELVKKAVPFTDEDRKFCEDFLHKPYSPKIQRS